MAHRVDDLAVVEGLLVDVQADVGGVEAGLDEDVESGLLGGVGLAGFDVGEVVDAGLQAGDDGGGVGRRGQFDLVDVDVLGVPVLRVLLQDGLGAGDELGDGERSGADGLLVELRGGLRRLGAGYLEDALPQQLRYLVVDLLEVDDRVEALRPHRFDRCEVTEEGRVLLLLGPLDRRLDRCPVDGFAVAELLSRAQMEGDPVAALVVVPALGEVGDRVALLVGARQRGVDHGEFTELGAAAADHRVPVGREVGGGPLQGGTPARRRGAVATASAEGGDEEEGGPRGRGGGLQGSSAHSGHGASGHVCLSATAPAHRGQREGAKDKARAATPWDAPGHTDGQGGTR